jgi:hypothetical protein
MLEERVLELKVIIAENDGRNAADRNFARAVDDLVSSFYDGIGRISQLPSRALFDLFLIKTLYVERRSTHADVIDYLGEMLDSFLYAQRLFPAGDDGRPRRIYFSDVTDEEAGTEHADRYEAYRRYADSALFFAGVLRRSLVRRRPLRAGMLRRAGTHAPTADASYFVATGRASYLIAAQEQEAGRTQRRRTLERLAEFFEVYAEALHDVGERYIIGVDRPLITDKLLDSINRHRETRDPQALADLRSYADMLDLDRDQLRGSPG